MDLYTYMPYRKKMSFYVFKKRHESGELYPQYKGYLKYIYDKYNIKHCYSYYCLLNRKFGLKKVIEENKVK